MCPCHKFRANYEVSIFQWLLASCVGRSCVSVVFFYFKAIITPLLPTDEMKEFFVVEEEEDSEAIK